MATGNFFDNALHYSGVGSLLGLGGYGGGGGSTPPGSSGPAATIRALANQFDPDQAAGLNALVSAAKASIPDGAQRAAFLTPILQQLPSQLAALAQTRAQQAQQSALLPYLTQWLQSQTSKGAQLGQAQAQSELALLPTVAAQYQPMLQFDAGNRAATSQQMSDALVGAFQAYPLLQMYQRQLGLSGSGSLFGAKAPGTQAGSSATTSAAGSTATPSVYALAGG